MPVVVRIVECH